MVKNKAKGQLLSQLTFRIQNYSSLFFFFSVLWSGFNLITKKSQQKKKKKNHLIYLSNDIAVTKKNRSTLKRKGGMERE